MSKSKTLLIILIQKRKMFKTNAKFSTTKIKKIDYTAFNNDLSTKNDKV